MDFIISETCIKQTLGKTDKIDDSQHRLAATKAPRFSDRKKKKGMEIEIRER